MAWKAILSVTSYLTFNLKYYKYLLKQSINYLVVIHSYDLGIVNSISTVAKVPPKRFTLENNFNLNQ